MNRIAGLIHRELVLQDGEGGLRKRRAFVEAPALSADVAVDVPVDDSVT